MDKGGSGREINGLGADVKDLERVVSGSLAAQTIPKAPSAFGDFTHGVLELALGQAFRADEHAKAGQIVPDRADKFAAWHFQQADKVAA